MPCASVCPTGPCPWCRSTTWRRRANRRRTAQHPGRTTLAYVIYTSGSTGAPKGVQIHHRALVNLLWAMRARPGLGPDDTLAAVTTIAFDIAALEVFLPLIVGARMVLATEAEARDGAALLGLLRRHGVTVMQATPVTWQMLIEAGWDGTPPLTMLCGGEALPRSLADQLLRRGGALWNMYGPTETTIWSSALRVAPGAGPVPLGPPIANTQFHVVDDALAPVPHGEPGELLIGGDGVAPGYFQLPEMTAARFIRDTFRNAPGARLYRTGDLVRQRADGCLDFLGRSDQQIKLRGFRIELGEIDAALLAHAAVAEAVAVAGRDPAGEPAIQAYAVLRPVPEGEAEVTAGALRSWLGGLLPAYMLPASITFLAALPRTPNGKIDRNALPPPAAEPPPAAPAAPAAPDAAATCTERRVARIWSAVLGRAVTDPSANFFELGGHSLLAARMLAQVHQEFRRRISLATLFEAPTVRALARQVDSADLRGFDFRQMVALQPHGARPTLFAINNTGIFVALANRLGRDQPFTALQIFDPAGPQQHHAGFEAMASAYVGLVRQVQPSGPYALIGWCNAGALAFEVGRQLFEATQQMPLVVLVDAWAPRHLNRLPWGRAALAMASHLQHSARASLRAMATAQRNWRERWHNVVADWASVQSGRQSWDEFLPRHRSLHRMLRLMRFRRLTRDGADRPLSGYLADEAYDDWLTRHLDAAARRFEPRRYPVRVLLLRSEREPTSRFLDHALGWGGFAAGGVATFVIAGDHFTMFQDPGVQQMAEHIADAVTSHGRAR